MKTSLIALPAIFLAVVAITAANDNDRKESNPANDSVNCGIGVYEAQRTTPKLRVTLLGVTKGFAFLESQEPAADGGRKHGNNAIPWLRVAVLAEPLGEHADLSGPIGFDVRTPQGKEIIEPTNVQLTIGGKSVALKSRAEGLAQIDPYSSRENNLKLFPTALPQVEKPEKSRLLILTLSGRFVDVKTADIIVSFGADTEREEAVFKGVPLP